jgi:ankyrin repeat protein
MRVPFERNARLALLLIGGMMSVAVCGAQQKLSASWLRRNTLLTAIRARDATLVATLLDRRDTARFLKSQDGYDLMLTAAAKNSNAEVIKVLMANGADLEARGPDGETPLYKAWRLQDLENIRALLDAGAKVNVQDSKGYTPLHEAVSTYTPIHSKHSIPPDLRLLCILLSHDAGVNLKTKTGFTPLQIALDTGSAEAARLLKAWGAVTDDEASHTLLCGVRNRDFAQVQASLTAGAQVNINDLHEWTPLMIASELGFVEAVRVLIRHGAAVDKVAHGFTALMLAAMNGHTEVVAALLEGHADPNYKNDRQWTALLEAARFHHLGPIRLLLEHGAQVNACNSTSTTPLMLAVSFPFNNYPSDQYLPLTEAGIADDREIVRLLLEKGADISLRDNEGKTALALALQFYPYIRAADLLRKAGAKE